MIASATRQILRLLPNKPFARSVVVLMGGTAGSQIILVLAAPILTRVYSPEDFGLLAVYMGLLALVAVISSLRYELAIPLPVDDDEAANVAMLCLLLVVTITMLTALLVGLMGSALAAALGVPTLARYLWLLPLGVLLTGAYSVFNYWAVRTKRFSSIAGTKLRQALITIAIQLASFKLGGIGLLLGQVAGQGVGTTRLGRSALASAGFRHVSLGGVAKAAKRYRHFPIFSTWEGLFNTAGLQLPPLMFAALFSAGAAGLYALAHRVLTLPMSLIGGAVGQVFFANAADAHRAGKLGPLVAQLHAKLAHIGMPPALILFLLGPDLFALVFGEDWRTAGEFARWMSPWVYLVFVYSPLSTILSVTDNLKQALTFQIVLLVARVFAISLGYWVGDLMITIMLFSGASAMCYLGFLLRMARLVGNPGRTMLQPTLAALSIALLLTFPILITLGWTETTPLAWMLAVVMTSILLAMRYWLLMREAY